MTTRRVTLQLLLLLAVFQHSQAQLRASKEGKVKRERPTKVQRRGQEDVVEPSSRVVGGQSVLSYTKHPYFAEWHNQFCGGALIHDDLVLTAAHCDNAGRITRDVYFKNIERAQDGAVKRTITDHVSHPLFNAQYSTRDYDYMLLKLDKSALVDDFGNPTGVKIIDINTDPLIPRDDDPLWGLGFGQVGETIAGMSDQLKEATIFTFANTKCESQYQQYFEQDYMFCSGVNGGGTDTCQGDSGGPVVHQDTGLLVGVVSFGIGCARQNYAGVNARVSAASDWLSRSMCAWSDYPKCNGSYSPTPAPSNSNGGTSESGTVANNNQNPGSVTITIVYDDYPEEVAWTLLGADKKKALQFQAWETATTQGLDSIETYDGLTQGITYNFKIADSEGDGICCSYGTGSIVIYDNVADDELWTSRGSFGPYYEVDFDILPNGKARVTHRSNHYKPSTWQDYEDMVAPTNEPFWPGRLPVQNVSTVMVNVDTDDYPEELSWELHHQSNNPTEGWVPVGTWNGAGTGLRTLDSFELSGLSRGWHRFVVRDSEGDGNCCEYGSGYVSLTGPLAVTNGMKGLIWGNDGKFWGMDSVFFYVENSGFISHTSLTEATVSRTIPQEPELDGDD